MNAENESWMLVMDGSELWTNAFGKRFGERVCVGFAGKRCVKDGVLVEPTDEEVTQLREDWLISEYGTSDMETILRIEGF